MNQQIISELNGENVTPAYIFDLDNLALRIEAIQKKLGGLAELCYAMKANPFLVGSMEKLVEKFEVCSPGELNICEREKIPMERIVLSGVNKEKTHVEQVLDTHCGEGMFTIESINQLKLLHTCAAQRNLVINVLIRVTSGNQFGIDESDLYRIIEKRFEYSALKFKGLQFYSGTQKKKIAKIEKELLYLDNLCKILKEQYGYEVEELEYGPGFFVSYFENEQEDTFAMLDELVEMLKNLKWFQRKITLEMGRYMVADCGYYASKIIDQKINMNQKYCIIDGGINHLNYYGQTMAMKIPRYIHIKVQKPIKNMEVLAEEYTICGSLCTVGDVLVKNLTLQNAKVNDILVFENAGAYSITEGIYLFLSRKLPKVYFYSLEQGMLLIRDALLTDTLNSGTGKE